ncbi:uncharacterized protein BJ171DRAFT_582957 [Polychytrium aggregatum]|uniref:uncharacterized protein n=1 Tax=Polychytrium aggregatum TaxID=110093 RepID=UPI0022FF1388|nr:uncharacterized protein BJ171DRAFT_582957 [Polychytrium aggregatum]KAI9203458.1 hypothetical protein BJ171DRAFT_582957 [Polychytrium aggregatum]
MARRVVFQSSTNAHSRDTLQRGPLPALHDPRSAQTGRGYPNQAPQRQPEESYPSQNYYESHKLDSGAKGYGSWHHPAPPHPALQYDRDIVRSPSSLSWDSRSTYSTDSQYPPASFSREYNDPQAARAHYDSSSSSDQGAYLPVGSHYPPGMPSQPSSRDDMRPNLRRPVQEAPRGVVRTAPPKFISGPQSPQHQSPGLPYPHPYSQSQPQSQSQSQSQSQPHPLDPSDLNSRRWKATESAPHTIAYGRGGRDRINTDNTAPCDEWMEYPDGLTTISTASSFGTTSTGSSGASVSISSIVNDDEDQPRFLLQEPNSLKLQLHIQSGDGSTIVTDMTVSLIQSVKSVVDRVKSLYSMSGYFVVYSDEKKSILYDDLPLGVYELKQNSILHIQIATGRELESRISLERERLKNPNLQPIDPGKIATVLAPGSLYLSVLIFNENKQIVMTKKGLLPSIEICHLGAKEVHKFTSDTDTFLWMKTTTLDWEPLSSHGAPSYPADDGSEPSLAFESDALYQRIKNVTGPNMETTSIRKGFLKAALSLLQHLDLKSFGVTLNSPVAIPLDSSGESAATMVLSLVFYRISGDKSARKNSPMAKKMKTAGLEWCSPHKLSSNLYHKSVMAMNTAFMQFARPQSIDMPRESAIDHSASTPRHSRCSTSAVWSSYWKMYQRSMAVLRPGTYVGAMYTHQIEGNTCKYYQDSGFFFFSDAHVMVQRHYQNMVPVMKLPDDVEVTSADFSFLTSRGASILDPADLGGPYYPTTAFQTGFLRAIEALSYSTGLDLHLRQLANADRPVDLTNRAHLYLLVAPVTSELLFNFNERDYMMLPLKLFEEIHYEVYDPITYQDYHTYLRTLSSRMIEMHRQERRRASVADISDQVSRRGETMSPMALDTPSHQRHPRPPPSVESDSMDVDPAPASGPAQSRSSSYGPSLAPNAASTRPSRSPSVSNFSFPPLAAHMSMPELQKLVLYAQQQWIKSRWTRIYFGASGTR